MNIIEYSGNYVKQDFKILRKGKNTYLDIFGCFDIETSLVKKSIAGLPLNPEAASEEYISFMYIWQYCDSTDTVYTGRTWKDFKRLLSDISKKYRLSITNRMVWYVHNLPFEFQFLRSVVEPLEVFATAQRKPVKFTIPEGIEFRCSYRLTNMSLAKFCESQFTGYKKMSGFDYNIVRYADTPLTQRELEYCIYDVISLKVSLDKLLAMESDTVTTVPLTSTGYVRREARDKSNDSHTKTLIKRTQLEEHEYLLCKKAIRGGDTHANYFHSAAILDDIWSYDRSSSYPHVMVTGDSFPVTKYVVEKNCTYLDRMPTSLSCIGIVEYFNLRLKRDAVMPYLPYSKAIAYKKGKYNDNGRVLSCENFVIALTEIDFEIVEKQYSYDKIKIHELMVADKGKLPKSYRDFVMEMYLKKSELKHADPYFYMKYKNKLNSTFGMMLTDIAKEENNYIDGKWVEAFEMDISKALRKYYNNPKSFLVYQHGLYVTAMARRELRRSIDICGMDTVYVDTDSNKHIGDHSKDFEKLNTEIHEENLACDIVPIVTVNGKEYEMGIWENEGEGLPMYKRFITMGAKKYAYQYPDGHYGVTVAGLSKKEGAKLLEERGLEVFETGLVFDPSYSGRLTAKYDDEIRLETIKIDGHLVEVTSNVSLVPTSYTLGLEKNYEALIHDVIQGNIG